MRFAGFLFRLFLFALFAVWLANNEGQVSLVWRGYAIETSMAVVVAILFVIFYFLWAGRQFLSFLREEPRVWRLRREIKKKEEGLSFLTKSMLALAAGDSVEAGRFVIHARKSLGECAATRIVQTQAAQIAGDGSSARVLLRGMVCVPETALYGYRGLIQSAVDVGDFLESDRLIRQAAAIAPKAPWIASMRFESAVRSRSWEEAVLALKDRRRLKSELKQKLDRDEATLSLARSLTYLSEGRTEEALKAAELALRLESHWVPSVLGVSRALIGLHRYKAAAKIIERQWRNDPHSDLAELYGQTILDPKPLDRYKALERLVRSNPDHIVSRSVLAQAALEAHLWGEARRRLVSLIKEGEATQAVYKMLAKLEEGEMNNLSKASQWLAQGLDAKGDVSWRCSHCGKPHTSWQPSCAYCTSFGNIVVF